SLRTSVTSLATGATEPRRLRKKSYRSPGPLGIAATLVLSSNGHAQPAGRQGHVVLNEDDPGLAIAMTEFHSRKAQSLERIAKMTAKQDSKMGGCNGGNPTIRPRACAFGALAA